MIVTTDFGVTKVTTCPRTSAIPNQEEATLNTILANTCLRGWCQRVGPGMSRRSGPWVHGLVVSDILEQIKHSQL
ncbi:hypothetical protein J6590_039931 [Homalodisca vitripennis]|nr:hypothetical protein J6590_039931 [Homalodisca vitripennis]